jgi:hypothetical protein
MFSEATFNSWRGTRKKKVPVLWLIGKETRWREKYNGKYNSGRWTKNK